MAQYHRDGPDGSLSSVMWQHDLQLGACRRHAHAEGMDVQTMTVLDSYDRTLHPWMHGRRPHDIAEIVRTWFD